MESIIQIHFPNKEPRPKRSNLSQTEFCDRSITVETLGILHGKNSTKQRIGLTGERRSARLKDVSLLSLYSHPVLKRRSPILFVLQATRICSYCLRIPTK